MNKYILCFLCVIPNETFLDFITTLGNVNYDIYVCVDNNDYKIENKWKNIKFIQIDNQICAKSGYRSLVGYFDGMSCSKDKALYYFNNNKIDYHYIWFIEDDTFIPSTNCIINIDNKYRDKKLIFYLQN
jgi:hypothetical protein